MSECCSGVLFVGLARRLHTDTKCGCGAKPADFSATQLFFDHVMSCKTGTQGTKLDRHNLLLPILGQFCQKVGYEWDTRPEMLSFPQVIDVLGAPCQPGRLRLDALAHYKPDSRDSFGVDVTVWHSGASTAECEPAATGPNAKVYITNRAEYTKRAKYKPFCDARGIKLLPAAFNTYGGWGTTVLQDLVEPYFNRLRAEEWEATGQEWKALHERELLFQSVSLAIARGNSLILDSLTHDWKNCTADARAAVRGEVDSRWAESVSDAAPVLLRDMLGGMC